VIGVVDQVEEEKWRAWNGPRLCRGDRRIVMCRLPASSLGLYEFAGVGTLPSWRRMSASRVVGRSACRQPCWRRSAHVRRCWRVRCCQQPCWRAGFAWSEIALVLPEHVPKSCCRAVGHVCKPCWRHRIVRTAVAGQLRMSGNCVGDLRACPDSRWRREAAMVELRVGGVSLAGAAGRRGSGRGGADAQVAHRRLPLFPSRC
jgi:hypothetical protein